MYQVESPVLLILFNRPEQTKKLFNAVKEAKPKQLFIGIDGPRDQDDQDKINQILKLIDNTFDFDCEVNIKNQTKNLGCGLGPRAAISWFFSNVEKGIILEDDCIPSNSFFQYADKLLEKYKSDKRIWLISGDNGGPILKAEYFGNDAYTFSNVPLIWGWASWKDRWDKYDENIDNWKKGTIVNRKNLGHVNIFEKFVVGTLCKNSSNSNNKNFWDFQMYSTMLKNKGFAIIPKNNLISNIGWGEIATHTKKENFRSHSNLLEVEIESFVSNFEVNKKINSIITYSVHTNVPKNIINTDSLNLIRIFYIINRVMYYFSYVSKIIKKR